MERCHTTSFYAVQRILQLFLPSLTTVLPLTIHRNIKIRIYSSCVLQGFLLHQPLYKAVEIQNYCLDRGYFLWYLYFSIDAEGFKTHELWYTKKKLNIISIAIMLKHKRNVSANTMNACCAMQEPS